MELNRLKTLYLLEMIAEEGSKSQREISNRLNISLGLVNAVIKRLIKKGYFKAKSLPSNRIKYILTPAGVMEKTRLAYEYVTCSYKYFKHAQKRLKKFYAHLENEGIHRIIFYGAGELGDIAFFALSETSLQLIDVVDPLMEGERFAHHIVKKISRLRDPDYDVVLITVAENHGVVINTLKDVGVPESMIRFFD